MQRRLVLTLAALTCLPFVASTASAQTWPVRPIKLVVPFPPGGLIDNMARLVAPKLGQELGQAIVIDNKPGAGGNIGADAVAKATDGHTIGLMINGNMTIARLLNPAVRYDPLKDLAPITLVGVAPRRRRGGRP